MPFVCYFENTWCGFTQRINEDADWMITSSMANGLIPSKRLQSVYNQEFYNIS